MILDIVKQWINRIKKSSFIKSVLSLSSGGLVGQVILTLSTPVIGRIYTASDMGDYTLIVSNANIIIAVSVLGMLTVFMLPKEDTEARELCRLVTLCSLIICSICVVFLYLISPYWKLLNTEGKLYECYKNRKKESMDLVSRFPHRPVCVGEHAGCKSNLASATGPLSGLHLQPGDRTELQNSL